MCGTWAVLMKNPTLTNKYLNLFNNVKNRGPDNSYIHVDKNYIIGFHRLSINDLSIFGNQPFFYSDKIYNYILIINGEIYNYKDLIKIYDLDIQSNSDCAVILPLFIKINQDFKLLNNLLRGEYSMLLIKQNISDLKIEYFISTDPLSVRPIFYFISLDFRIGISSILNGLNTLSNNIIRLDQGTYLYGMTNFESYNDYTIINYHNYNLIPLNFYIDIDNLYNDIVKCLTESISIRLNSDRPLGCLLSGGLDSSLVAAIAAKNLKEKGMKLKTFSIGMKDGSDLKYARMVSEYINSEHTEFIFTSDEGIDIIDNVIKATETYDITTIRASIAQFLLAKNISEKTNIKVLLNGDGADECQMGYLYFYLSPNIEEAIKERNKLLKQIHYFDGLRVDRNLSYHGLEARVPFLDKNFVDLYLQIPGEYLIPTEKYMEKYLIRKAFSTILPDLLPQEVLWRRKEAFSDGVSSQEKSWFQILKNHFNNLISDEEYNNNNNFEYLKSICKESYYYRKTFNQLFDDNHKIIPRFWLPNWSCNNDPSARTLNIYNK